MNRVLFGFAVVLAVILLLQWRERELEPHRTVAPESVADVAAMPSPPASAETAPMPKPEEDYVMVTERPLFLPDRRPPEDEPVEEVDEQDASAEVADIRRLDVTATLILSATDASVWVRDPEGPELLRLRLGDDYEGWTVAGIEHDRVIMERQGETEALDLMNFSRPDVATGRPTRASSRKPAVRSPVRRGF